MFGHVHVNWRGSANQVNVGVDCWDFAPVSTLTINYRTPREVMVEAEPVIRAAIPDANVPISVRSSSSTWSRSPGPAQEPARWPVALPLPRIVRRNRQRRRS